MIIRKLYRFEGAHAVGECASERCRDNIHGHSYVVEVFITSDRLDRGGMVMDFGLLGEVRAFIDRFDHTYLIWQGADEAFKSFAHQYSSRVAELPVVPTAEGLALLFLWAIDRILSRQKWQNGEGNVRVTSVRVHETSTGYAEAFRDDLPMAHFTAADIHFSAPIQGCNSDF